VNTTKETILSILSEAENRNFQVGKTQLVKYMYLVEVEYFRKTGKRLTDLEWKFYHFGPYAFELESILNLPEFIKEKIELGSGKIFSKFTIAEPLPKYKDIVDAKLSLIIKRVVSEWGDKALHELLDFVYFETEPMEAVKKRGDILNFSTIQREISNAVIPLKASKVTIARITELKKRIAPALKRLSEQRINALHKDKDYEEATAAWGEGISNEYNPEDLKNILLTITESPHASGQKRN
jgi:uncharacterized phage-associated protein